jgi:hypothetical protein
MRSRCFTIPLLSRTHDVNRRRASSEQDIGTTSIGICTAKGRRLRNTAQWPPRCSPFFYCKWLVAGRSRRLKSVNSVYGDIFRLWFVQIRASCALLTGCAGLFTCNWLLLDESDCARFGPLFDIYIPKTIHTLYLLCSFRVSFEVVVISEAVVLR